MRLRIGIAAGIAVLKLACSAPPEPAAPDHGASTAHRGDDGRSRHMAARTGLYRIQLLAKGPLPIGIAR